LRNGPSPRWLQDRLVAIGLRPINALVDVTNLFTFDLGRPLHVFDLKKVHGGTLTMRMARDGESLAALNGKEYALTRRTASSPTRRGWSRSAGSSAARIPAATRARRRPSSNARCSTRCGWRCPGRRHDVRTDARARFERGLDPALMRPALKRRRA
jgi:phenylalanyl-tRNA synthetase beta chain